MHNIILVGASGFVGTRLIATANDSFVLSNLDKQQSPFFPELTKLGDVRNPADIEKPCKTKIQ